MFEFEDDIDRLASAGLIRRHSSVMGLHVKFSSCHSELSSKQFSLEENHNEQLIVAKTTCRVLVMGATRVGKTSIITQLLYNKFLPQYKATVEEMYRGTFDVGHTKLCLNIEDTSGTFAFDFPAMLEVSLLAADAVLLVFSVDDVMSLEQVATLREMVMKTRGPAMPVVVVGNKIDLKRKIDKAETESLVTCNWQNGYVECSSKENSKVQTVFKELLNQVEIKSCSTVRSSSYSFKAINRRQSMPGVSAYSREEDKEKKEIRRDMQATRRKSIANILGEESCKMC